MSILQIKFFPKEIRIVVFIDPYSWFMQQLTRLQSISKTRHARNNPEPKADIIYPLHHGGSSANPSLKHAQSNSRKAPVILKPPLRKRIHLSLFASHALAYLLEHQRQNCACLYSRSPYRMQPRTHPRFEHGRA